MGDDFSNALDKAKQGVEDFVNDPWGKTKEVASDAWDGVKETANEAWEWTKKNKEYIAAGVTIAAGVALCFVAPPVGAGILIGTAVSGGISAAQGNDLKTIMGDAVIGGIAGAVGGGVAGGVARGAVRYVGQKAAQLIGNSTGGAVGSLTDDFLRGKKFNWKNAAVAAILAGGITYGVHTAQKAAQAPVFGITPKAQYTANKTVNATVARNTPGIATATRLPNTDHMMRGSQGNVGVIPKEIGEQLKGKHYNTFDDLREDFWKTVANSRYAKEFSPGNIARMKNGKAPYSIPEQWHGKHRSYILHHKHPIHDGGKVYES